MLVLFFFALPIAGLPAWLFTQAITQSCKYLCDRVWGGAGWWRST